MSILIHIYYTGQGGNARRFAEEMERSGTAAQIREAPGNEQYNYFFPMHDPETVLLIDRWTDQAAIDRHHASPMMETIAQLREQFDLHMQVVRCITDDGGIPDNDKHFIRK